MATQVPILSRCKTDKLSRCKNLHGTVILLFVKPGIVILIVFLAGDRFGKGAENGSSCHTASREGLPVPGRHSTRGTEAAALTDTVEFLVRIRGPVAEDPGTPGTRVPSTGRGPRAPAPEV
eukprot:247589-Rhodomonas_salina.1